MNAPNPNAEKELFHIAGDMDTGVSATLNLDTAKRELVGSYKFANGVLVQLVHDLYEYPGSPLKVITICPRCMARATPDTIERLSKQTLTIQGDNKRIEYDRQRGTVSVEKFRCTWELDGTKDIGRIAGTGSSNVCGATYVIDNNVLRDA